MNMLFPLQFTSQCESCVLKSKSILPRGHFDAKVIPLRRKVECTNLIFVALSNVFLTSNHGKDGGFGDDNDDMMIKTAATTMIMKIMLLIMIR